MSKWMIQSRYTPHGSTYWVDWAEHTTKRNAEVHLERLHREGDPAYEYRIVRLHWEGDPAYDYRIVEHT